MTKTINQMYEDLAAIESMASQLVADSREAANGLQAGMNVAGAVAGVTLLDLTLKGALPEGSYGRIIKAVNAALKASEEKVIDGSKAEVPGTELPPAGQ